MITPIINVKGGEYALSADGLRRPVKTYWGLSTDTKPIEGVNDADRYFEKDKGAMYVFDEDVKDWFPIRSN